MSIKAALLATVATASLVGAAAFHSHVNFNVNKSSKVYINELTHVYKDEISVSIYDIDDMNPQIEKALDVLRTANEDTRVCIDINSYGGEVRLLYELINEINDSKAQVVTVLNGFAFSAGGTLLLAGDLIKFGKESIIMLHRVRVNGPDGPELTDDIASRLMNLQILRYYKGLLTEKEIEAFVEGEDVYIDGEEFKRRIGLVYPERLSGDNVCK